MDLRASIAEPKAALLLFRFPSNRPKILRQVRPSQGSFVVVSTSRRIWYIGVNATLKQNPALVAEPRLDRPSLLPKRETGWVGRQGNRGEGAPTALQTMKTLLRNAVMQTVERTVPKRTNSALFQRVGTLNQHQSWSVLIGFVSAGLLAGLTAVIGIEPDDVDTFRRLLRRRGRTDGKPHPAS